MTRGVQVFAAVLVGVAVAACSDDSPTVPSSPQLAVTEPVQCKQNLASAAAKDYFEFKSMPLGRVLDLIKDIASSQVQGTQEATDSAFQLFAIVEQETAKKYDPALGATPVIGTPEDGSDLTNYVLACTDLGVTTAVVPAEALEEDGAYCVRGGSGAADNYEPCRTFSLTADPPVIPFHGSYISPPPAGFHSWFGEERLIYAFKAGSLPPPHELIVDFDGAVYDWSTLPDAPLTNGAGPADKGVIGICGLDVTNALDTLRIQHDTANILLVQDADFCPAPPPSFGLFNRGTPLFRFARSAFGWALPEPLFASAVAAGGGTGGSLGDLSPFAVVYAVNVNLEFVQVPAGGVVNTPLTPPVKVSAVGAEGVPFVDLTITLELLLNSTTNANLTNNVALTDENGVATFTDLQVDKTGVYQLIAEAADLPGTPVVSAPSTKFVVNPN
jgi:hypothetical protein